MKALLNKSLKTKFTKRAVFGDFQTTEKSSSLNDDNVNGTVQTVHADSIILSSLMLVLSEKYFDSWVLYIYMHM